LHPLLPVAECSHQSGLQPISSHRRSRITSCPRQSTMRPRPVEVARAFGTSDTTRRPDTLYEAACARDSATCGRNACRSMTYPARSPQPQRARWTPPRSLGRLVRLARSPPGPLRPPVLRTFCHSTGSLRAVRTIASPGKTASGPRCCWSVDWPGWGPAATSARSGSRSVRARPRHSKRGFPTPRPSRKGDWSGLERVGPRLRARGARRKPISYGR